MYVYREEEELLADALRRAYRARTSDDDRFEELLTRIDQAAKARMESEER